MIDGVLKDFSLWIGFNLFVNNCDSQPALQIPYSFMLYVTYSMCLCCNVIILYISLMSFRIEHFFPLITKKQTFEWKNYSRKRQALCFKWKSYELLLPHRQSRTSCSYLIVKVVRAAITWYSKSYELLLRTRYFA